MRIVGFWVGAALLLNTATAPADDPHLEIIRGLRAQGDADLAVEYIEQRVPKNLPPELAQIIALELARSRVELAGGENEEGKRLALFAAARTEFEAFLQANPNHPLAPQARFEIARLTAAQGKEAVNRARRAEGPARTKALTDARPRFQDAVKQLRDAAKLLKERRDNTEDRAELRDLTQSWLQAQLEEGINLFQLALTHATEEQAGTEEYKLRAALLTDAGKVFDKLSTEDDGRHPLNWVARAWLARIHFENDDFPKANEQFDLIQSERGPHVEDAKRIAAYFRILMTRKQGTATRTAQLTQLQSWLERYRAYQNTPEGCGVRFFLADVLEGLAEDTKGIRRDERTGRPVSVSNEAFARLKEAERVLRQLTEFENDFTDRAANRRMRIILAIAIKQAPDRDPKKLTTFENCYLLALLQIAELTEELKKPEVEDNPELAATMRRQRYAAAAEALDYALTLVNPSDPPKEVQDARVLQVYSHFVAGHHHQAAILGEHLARQMVRQSRGAAPALYALQAYRNVMLESKARGTASNDELRTDRDHVYRLATWMEANWPNDTLTDTARHTLGTLYFNEGDFVNALAAYARVSPNYVALAFLRNEQGIACFNLQRNPAVSPQVRQEWFQRIVAELESMPDLGTGAEPDVAYAYCMARLQLGNLLLQEGKQFARVEQIGKAVLDSASKLVLGSFENEVRHSAQAVMLLGLYGRVFELVKLHQHKDAANVYVPVIAEFEKNPLPDEESANRPRDAFAKLLQLALRSSVQDGEIDRAQSLLKQMEKLSAAGSSASAALVAVLAEVQAQITDMRRNDPARLRETMEKFGTFLETLAKQPNLTRDVKLFLAQGFGALDKPVRAVELLATIPPPGATPTPPAESASDEEQARYAQALATHEADQKAHWFTQLTHVRLLRHAGRLAEDAAEKAKYFSTADRMLDEMIGSGQNKGWAFNSLEVRREKIFLLEDQEKWRPALDAWVAMQKPFQGKFNNPPKDAKEAAIRAAFFEIRFYMMRLVYQSKAKLKDETKKLADIKRLAEQIVELEKDERTRDFGGANIQKLYQNWLDEEPLIRSAYIGAGGQILVGGGAVPTAGP